MRVFIVFTFLVLFIFAVISLFYVIWKMMSQTYRNRDESDGQNLVNTFKSTILLHIGGKQTIINLLLISFVITLIIFTAIAMSG